MRILNMKSLFKRFHENKKEEKYPKICPFCREKKRIAKDWARFPNHKLTKRDKAEKPLFLTMTDQAEHEWYDFIVCLNCYRIIWHHLDFQGRLEREIPLPDLQELTGWQETPHSPVVLYDKEGNPVYGTKHSKEIYQKNQGAVA